MSDEPLQSEVEQLRARVAVLERLQEELERIVAAQADTLQQAVAEERARARQLQSSEELLRQRTRILHSVIESMEHGVVVANEAGEFVIFNRAARRILRAGPGGGKGGSGGLTPDDWTKAYGLFLPDRVTPYPPEDLPLRQAMAGETVQGAEIFVRHDQTPPEGVWLVVTACPLLDDAGQRRGGVAVFRDVSEHRRALEALTASERRFRELFERSPDPVVVEDLDGNVLDANPAACRLHGCGRDELVGRNLLDLVPPDRRDEMLQDFSRLARGEIDHAEGFAWTSDGRAVPVEVRVGWIDYPTAAGKVPAVLFHVRDITERKRHEEELRRARDAAEEASRAKSAFLSSMSHEIRTPMHGVMGLSELLLESGLSAEQREHVELIRKSGEALLGVINDVLDFSKIEAGRLDLDPKPFRVRELVGDVLDTLAVRARRKGLQLRRRVADDVPDAVVGDGGRLRQVLLNLVGNAVKFTERGEVVVTVQEDGGQRTEDRGQKARSSSVLCPPSSVLMRFEVRDTGIGIPPEKQALLFQPFSQVDGGLTRRYEGTGLGLAISRRLTELMGGSVWCESEPGRGSTFHVRVPLLVAPSEPSAAPSASPPATPPRPLRVLLAEDNPVNQRLAVALLERRGHSVTVAPDGRQAVAAAERERFDIILMDVQMPEMDGLEATRRIRASESPGRRVPIVAMTAAALRSDRDRCLEAGMDDYISKPVRTEELVAALARFAPPRDAAPPNSRAAPAHPTCAAGTAEDFDPSRALKHVGGDRRLLVELIRLYLADSPGWLAELGEAVRRGDAPAVRRAAHNLKGALLHFGLSKAVAAAQAVEFLGRDATLDGAAEAHAALRCELDRLRPQLAAYCGD